MKRSKYENMPSVDHIPSVYTPRKGDKFEHKTRGICTFLGALNSRQYKMETSTGAVLHIWRTELPKYWKVADRQREAF